MSTPAADPQTVHLTIDGREATVTKGTTILDAAGQLGIRIPTLCHHADLLPTGSCRVCLVEIGDGGELVTACDRTIDEPLAIRTHSRRIWRERRDILNRLFAEHDGWPSHGFQYCHTCPRDGTCQLQRLASEYGVAYGNRPPAAPPPVEILGDVMERELGKCVRCERCSRTCDQVQDVGALCMATDARFSPCPAGTEDDKPHTYPQMSHGAVCFYCGQCAAHCPTAALRPRDETSSIVNELADQSRHVVVQTAPAPRVGIGEEFGISPGRAMTWELNTALRNAGFDAVFDSCFAADLTIVEEGTELLARLHANRSGVDARHPLPLLTSCCPAWIRYAEHAEPALLAHLSTCKSPQQMFGALIKSFYARERKLNPDDVVSVALMPCVAKKAECERPEMSTNGRKHVDYALTTRECATLLKAGDQQLAQLEPSPFDDFFSSPSGSGVVFGKSGGVMESALGTVIELVTGQAADTLLDAEFLRPVEGFEGCRIGEIRLPSRVAEVPALLKGRFEDFNWLAGRSLRVGVVAGLRAIKQAVASLKAGGGPFASCHFIELMACPAGCIAGGGQPSQNDADTRQKRESALQQEAAAYAEKGLARRSHENQAVLRVYRDWLTDGPGGKTAHAHLHTQYAGRERRSP